MRFLVLFSFFFLIFGASDVNAATTGLLTDFKQLTLSTDGATPQVEFPIFGKNKTSNKKQRKFAMKRSRRHGKGVMKARKQRGANNGRSVKGGGKAKRGSKKKEGCNT